MSRSRKVSKFWILNNFPIVYDFKFDPIKSYLDDSVEMIKELSKRLDEKYVKWDKEHSDESYPKDYPDAYDIYETEIMNQGEYGNLLKNSTFLTIYSMFEIEYNNLCLWCKKAANLNGKPTNGKGSIIEKCQNYITKKLKLNLERTKSEWNEILIIKDVRNSIVHNNGEIIVKASKPEVVDYISTNKGLKLNNEVYNEKQELISFTVEIENIEFLKRFTDLVNKYLSSVSTTILTQHP